MNRNSTSKEQEGKNESTLLKNDIKVVYEITETESLNFLAKNEQKTVKF